MSLANNIKRLREQKGLLQKEEAAEMGLGIFHNSIIKNEQREAYVGLMDKKSKFYGITTDQNMHMCNEVPTEITIEDKTVSEQVRLNTYLDEKD